MKAHRLNQIITFALAVNILIATAIRIFMDETVFLEKYQFTIGNYYGISIVLLIGYYIFFQLLYEDLDSKYIKRVSGWSLVSILSSGITLLASIYPSLFSFFILSVLTASITLNIIIWIILLVEIIARVYNDYVTRKNR